MTRSYHGEDFCLIHGFNHMRQHFGHPIPYCAACEGEEEPEPTPYTEDEIERSQARIAAVLGIDPDDVVEDGQAECHKCGEWYRITAPRIPHVCAKDEEAP